MTESAENKKSHLKTNMWILIVGVLLFTVYTLSTIYFREDTVELKSETDPVEKTLADGTEIVLGPNSTLVVPTAFVASSRKVELSGSCMFHIEDDEKTFIIQTRAGSIYGNSGSIKVDSADTKVVSIQVNSGTFACRPFDGEQLSQHQKTVTDGVKVRMSAEDQSVNVRF